MDRSKEGRRQVDTYIGNVVEYIYNDWERKGMKKMERRSAR